MGKRSDFERNPRDFYPTPFEAVTPLLPHLQGISTFAEPCAGDGKLMDHLSVSGFTCSYACDIEPQRDGVEKLSCFDVSQPLADADCIITNPPWDRKLLHPMIDHFRTLNDITWLLFDADWVHTKQSRDLIQYCSKIVSVGRVKWIEGSKTTGKDNCAWYQFGKHKTDAIFVGRR